MEKCGLSWRIEEILIRIGRKGLVDKVTFS